MTDTQQFHPRTHERAVQLCRTSQCRDCRLMAALCTKGAQMPRREAQEDPQENSNRRRLHGADHQAGPCRACPRCPHNHQSRLGAVCLWPVVWWTGTALKILSQVLQKRLRLPLNPATTLHSPAQELLSSSALPKIVPNSLLLPAILPLPSPLAPLLHQPMLNFHK